MIVAGLGAPALRNEPLIRSEFNLPPRPLVDKLGVDYGQVPVHGTPFADPLCARTSRSRRSSARRRGHTTRTQTAPLPTGATAFSSRSWPTARPRTEATRFSRNLTFIRNYRADLHSAIDRDIRHRHRLTGQNCTSRPFLGGESEVAESRDFAVEQYRPASAADPGAAPMLELYTGSERYFEHWPLIERHRRYARAAKFDLAGSGSGAGCGASVRPPNDSISIRCAGVPIARNNC